MNIVLWVLQVLLAIHTAMGAAWKFKHTERSVVSLRAIPHGAWLALGAVEFLCVVGLIVPAIVRAAGVLAPVAAVVIAAEMLLFCGVHLRSGDRHHSHLVYWLVVAAVCACIAYGRFVLSPF